MTGILLIVLAGLVSWGLYRAVQLASARWDLVRDERDRRALLDLARSELALEPSSPRASKRSHVMLEGTAGDTSVRIITGEGASDVGPQTQWLVEIDDAAFDAPREELPSLLAALRETAVLPEPLTLDIGRLRYTEPTRSAPQAIARIRALLKLLDGAEPGRSSPPGG